MVCTVFFCGVSRGVECVCHSLIVRARVQDTDRVYTLQFGWTLLSAATDNDFPRICCAQDLTSVCTLRFDISLLSVATGNW